MCTLHSTLTSFNTRSRGSSHVHTAHNTCQLQHQKIEKLTLCACSTQTLPASTPEAGEAHNMCTQHTTLASFNTRSRGSSHVHTAHNTCQLQHQKIEKLTLCACSTQTLPASTPEAGEAHNMCTQHTTLASFNTRSRGSSHVHTAHKSYQLQH